MVDKGLKIRQSKSTLGQMALHNVKILFGLDTRSMALFRVFVGLTVIGDLLNRW